MRPRYDLAVIGSGFAGSLIAMIARRLGLSVLLLEKGRHPRVVIGESSTPLSNLLLEELAERYNLPQLQPLTKWGRWQQSYPHLACGLKRGFSFFHQELGEAQYRASLHQRQLLVAASPHDAIADTHWYRADVDAWLVHEAQEIGVEYLDELLLDRPVGSPGGWSLTGKRGAQTYTMHATLLLDATGPRGFLHRALGIGALQLPRYPETSALYSHFSGVEELAYSDPGAPYPVNAAAVHHVFEGGWLWVLRFNNGITSAGVAATKQVAHRFNFSEKAKAWDRLLAALPEVRQQFSGAVAERSFVFEPQLSFRSAQVTGPGWALMPSAYGFVDPLLSTGFPLSLLGISRLAHALEQDWNTPRFEKSLSHYGQQTEADLLAAARLIAGLYACMGDMPTFRTLSLLYFAAASYAETARRLGKPEFASGFLLHDHPHFGPESERLLARAAQPMTAPQRLDLQREVYALIGPFDVAGLSLRPGDSCYPVRAADLTAAGPKLNASSAEIERLLERSGFCQASLNVPAAASL